MKRPIKFRVWDVQSEKMFEPKEISNNLICCTPEDDDEQFFVHMEFTGLLDKNGKELWEGDIIRWDFEKLPEIVTHTLSWDGRLNPDTAPFMSAWGSTDGRYFKTFMNVFDSRRYAVVVGNVYQNPELINS